MPANLTPQYQKAEEEYRCAQTAEERVACLTTMLQIIPKHKGTERLQADLKTKLKETRAEAEAEKKAPKKGPSYRFPRQGAGTILVIGGPNAGKSRTLAELTHAEPVVADYPYSTHEPLPGMMAWEDATVQLIDTPPVTASHFEPYVVNLVRSADAVALCFDGGSDDAPEATADVVAQLADRKTKLGTRSGFDDEDFSIVTLNALLAVTRGDDPGAQDRLDFLREMTPIDFPIQFVEFDRPESREALRTSLYRLLDVIRVYTKKPGKPADLVDPYAIRRGGTIEDLAAKVHRDLAQTLKFAKVWGDSAHDGQSVGRDHVLADRDVVELHA